jgi:hypothetical protein
MFKRVTFSGRTGGRTIPAWTSTVNATVDLTTEVHFASGLVSDPSTSE